MGVSFFEIIIFLQFFKFTEKEKHCLIKILEINKLKNYSFVFWCLTLLPPDLY